MVLSHLALEWAVTEQLGRAAERTKGLMLPRVLSSQTERGLGQFSVPQRQGRKLCVCLLSDFMKYGVPSFKGGMGWAPSHF